MTLNRMSPSRVIGKDRGRPGIKFLDFGRMLKEQNAINVYFAIVFNLDTKILFGPVLLI
jgi:hypothetical protein